MIRSRYSAGLRLLLVWSLASSGALAGWGCGDSQVRPADAATDTTAPSDRALDAVPDTADLSDGVPSDSRQDADTAGPDLPRGPAAGAGGSACTADADCTSGVCLTESATGFPGGYCVNSVEGFPADFPPDIRCRDETAAYVLRADGRRVCAQVCTLSDDCRTGYRCAPAAAGFEIAAGVMACVPEASAGQLGDACASGPGCATAPAYCLTEAEALQFTGGSTAAAGMGSLPDNYCTYRCLADDDCGADGFCVTQLGLCARRCSQDGDCRPGHACGSHFMGAATTGSVCAPGNSQAAFGDPCGTPADCPVGRAACLTEAGQRFPGGYCTHLCDTRIPGVCGEGMVCVADLSALTDDAGIPFFHGLCAPTCASDAECGRPGYVCEAGLPGLPSSQKVCTPGLRGAVTGDACETHAACAPVSFCIHDRSLPGGYCSQSCEAATPRCPDGALCTQIAAGPLAGYVQTYGREFASVASGRRAPPAVDPRVPGICLATCIDTTECRGGYQCDTELHGHATSTTVCAPGTSDPVAIGAPCTDGSACTLGQYCLDYPGGYCGQPCNPADAGSCGADHCFYGSCLATCTSAADCMDGRDPADGAYGCTDRLGSELLPDGVRLCVPYTAGSSVGDDCEGLGDCPLGGYCWPGPKPGLSAPICLLAPCDEAHPCPAGHRCGGLGDSDSQCGTACDSSADCPAGFLCATGGACLPIPPPNSGG